MSEHKEHRDALIIFVRNPELGKVKTRLAAGVGDEAALDIYIKLLTHTRKVALSVDAHRYLFYHEWINDGDDWSSADFQKHLQVDADLGEKMKTAFAKALSENDKVLIIGSDCPQLKTIHLTTALDALDNHDVVIGPSLDGGYYLLGMKQLHDQLFDDVQWSTDQVYSETIRRCDKGGLRHHSLEPLSDVDYVEDWEQYGW